jgi:uncharacterized protein
VRVVVDTILIFSDLVIPSSALCQVLRLCLGLKIKPLIGSALFIEYRDVMARDELFKNCPVLPSDRDALLNAPFSVAE